MLKFRTMTVDADQSAHHAYIAQTMNGHHVSAVGELYKLDRRDRRNRRPGAGSAGRAWTSCRSSSTSCRARCRSWGRGRACRTRRTTSPPHHFERFLAPPGITGLWQVTARAHASFAEALEMDVAYVRDWSLGLDLSLILRTPAEVFRQRRATV